jgi:hypothetical protein
MKPMIEEDMRWQAEDDARTLERASEINGDPKRLDNAKMVLQEKLDNTKKVLKGQPITGMNDMNGMRKNPATKGTIDITKLIK